MEAPTSNCKASGNPPLLANQPMLARGVPPTTLPCNSTTAARAYHSEPSAIALPMRCPATFCSTHQADSAKDSLGERERTVPADSTRLQPRRHCDVRPPNREAWPGRVAPLAHPINLHANLKQRMQRVTLSYSKHHAPTTLPVLPGSFFSVNRDIVSCNGTPPSSMILWTKGEGGGSPLFDNAAACVGEHGVDPRLPPVLLAKHLRYCVCVTISFRSTRSKKKKLHRRGTLATRATCDTYIVLSVLCAAE